MSPAPDDAAPGAMEAEFDEVARWTGEIAHELGPRFAIPAGCRGSGSPAALDWLTRSLQIGAGDRVLDVGAGIGGPGAWLRERTGARPLLTEPAAGAVAAARLLFDLPVVRADAACLPFASASFDALWCLGVVSTLPGEASRAALFSELRRVLRARGRLGLLVLLRGDRPIDDPPDGNDFVTERGFGGLLAAAGLEVVDRVPTGDVPAVRADPDWDRLAEQVRAALEDRHGTEPAWLAATDNERKLASLLGDGSVTSWLFRLRPSG